MAIRPIDQGTLNKVSSQEQMQGLAQLGTAMSEAAKFREAQKQNKSMKELRDLQMVQANLGMEKTKYDMKQDELADKIEATEYETRQRYLKNIPDLGDNPTSKDYTEAMQIALRNNAPTMAKHYSEMAKLKGKPAAKGKTPTPTELEKLKNAEKTAALEGRYEDAAEYRTAINKKKGIEATRVSADAIQAAASRMESQTSGEGAGRIGDYIANVINTGTADEKVANIIASGVSRELQKGDNSFVVDDGFTDTVDYSKVDQLVGVWTKMANKGITPDSFIALAKKNNTTVEEIEKQVYKQFGLILD